jgi:hypothetical protein
MSSLEDVSQTTRKRKVTEFCKNFKDSKEKYFPQIRLVTDPDKHLAYCHVPKVASSAWMLIFARLHQDQFKFDKQSDEHVMLEELLESGQLHEMMLKNFSIIISGSGEKQDVFKFVFLRHPFERLVSGGLPGSEKGQMANLV